MRSNGVSSVLWTLALATAGAGLLASGAHAQKAHSGRGIYTCTDPAGRRLTSDRPIAECMTREQRLLNSDGSLRAIIPPALTADERAAQEARERRLAEERLAQQDAIRRDRNLMQRYPTQAAHDKARASALEDIQTAMRITERRLEALAAERKPLMVEAEFYAGKPLPNKLKQQFNANDAATAAQRALVQTQQAELIRINALYDAELARLRRLWAGQAPGSMGKLPEALASDKHKQPVHK
jgi:hypothetical protein